MAEPNRPLINKAEGIGAPPLAPRLVADLYAELTAADTPSSRIPDTTIDVERIAKAYFSLTSNSTREELNVVLCEFPALLSRIAALEMQLAQSQQNVETYAALWVDAPDAKTVADLRSRLIAQEALKNV